MPVLVRFSSAIFQNKSGKTHGRENVVGLHTVIPVISTKLKKLRQILVPGVQINRGSALRIPSWSTATAVSFTSLIQRITPPAAPSNPRILLPVALTFPEIQAHAPAKFTDLCKVVHASVNSFQAIRHSVNKTAGKLMVRFPGIGQGWGGHGNLHTAEHIIKPAHPLHPAILTFLHGQVQEMPRYISWGVSNG